MVVDVQSVDLIKLVLNVKKKGGYKWVTENGLWDSVAKECGFDVNDGLALKLVYVGCLDRFLECLKRVSEERDVNSGVNVKHSISDICGECSVDLGSNLEPFLSEVSDIKKNKDAEYVKVDWNKCETDAVCLWKLSEMDDCHDLVKLNGEIENGHTISICNHVIDHVDIISVNKDILDSGGIPNVIEESHASVEFKSINTTAYGNESVVIIDPSDITVVKEDVCCLKRKRGESTTGMLNWICRVAQDPCDPAIGSLPESSEWKHYTTDNIWKQVLLIHEAMLLRRNGDSNDQHFTVQKRQRMHPTMYDDPDKLRYSQRIHSAKDPLRKSRARIILKSSSSGMQRDEDYQDESPESTTKWMPDYLANRSRQMRVYIGPEYQADVHEWTGKTYEVDSKWSGTRIWPLGRAEQNKSLIEREPLGKGRPDSCGCQFSGSTECVKFHVSEKRKRLRLELGIAFYLWRFNRMGEETLVSWTKEEENKFHDTWKLNPLSFLDESIKSLPNKSRASLVSYYFNVFLFRRRGDQNRTTPNNITSDDDESDTESEDVKPLDSIFCTPKKAKLKKSR